jgi:hypothetical protein
MLDDRIVLRPFPIGIADAAERKRRWTSYRRDMLRHAGVAIFLFGNKKDSSGKTVLAVGMEEEFRLSAAAHLAVVPVGCTGSQASELHKLVLANFADYYPAAGYKGLFEALRQERQRRPGRLPSVDAGRETQGREGRRGQLMARKVFYSFHYQPDCARAALVRNMGVVEGNKPATDHDWEKITGGGASAIKTWIDNQLFGKTCNVVLIGTNTAGCKWINYEIKTAWNGNRGVVGVYIHKLAAFGIQSSKGLKPFDGFTMKGTQKKLSSIVQAYNPPYSNSKDVYAFISENLEDWIEEAIEIRDNYEG